MYVNIAAMNKRAGDNRGELNQKDYLYGHSTTQGIIKRDYLSWFSLGMHANLDLQSTFLSARAEWTKDKTADYIISS